MPEEQHLIGALHIAEVEENRMEGCKASLLTERFTDVG